jgi:predicted metal-dependent hydrolase
LVYFRMKDLRQGVKDYGQGRYWEAHEAWERHWKDMEHGPERLRLQGWIQLCGVAVLLEKGRRAAAVRLARSALGKLGLSAAGTGLVDIPGGEDWLTLVVNEPASAPPPPDRAILK